MGKLGFLSVLCCLVSAAYAGEPDATVYVDTDTTVVRDYMGVGVQWDPNDVWDYTPAQWTLLTARVDFLRPSFIRCMMGAGNYCTGFGPTGEPIYQWDSRMMKRLYPILDYCQSHGIEVMLGEWGAPFGWRQDDPRWSRVISDCLDYLVNRKGYTCIRYYNKINEPTGDVAAYQIWKRAQKGLKDELLKRGLSPRVLVVGPDHSEGKNALRWIGYILKDGAEIMDAYETHWYASSNTEIPNGDIEATFREARSAVDAQDPAGKSKRFFVGEAGTGEWLNSRDSNRHIRDYAYGVYMSDYLAQTMRAGLAGVSAWMLDDAMHQQPGSYPPGGVPSGNAKVDFDFKVWGFWNSQGTTMGRPDDEALRPWFYTWSLLSRCLPRGSRVVYATDPGLQGVRVVAALKARGAEQDVSIVVVNDAAAPRSLRVIVPNATSPVSLKQYDYFENNRMADASGFPVAKCLLSDARLAEGLMVSLPSQGVVLFSSLDGGSATTLASGKPVPVARITLRGENETVQQGATMRFTAQTDPPGHTVTWSVAAQGGDATISPTGMLAAKGLGKVQVTASCPGSAVKAQTVVEVTKDRLLVDPLNDWSRVYGHTENLQFENINEELFENDPSRVKRGINTVESFTYKFASAQGFAITVYHLNAVAGVVKVYASPDGAAWREVEIRAEATVPTKWEFKRSVLHPASLPAGTNYLRIELGRDKEIFAPQIGQVELVSYGQ